MKRKLQYNSLICRVNHVRTSYSRARRDRYLQLITKRKPRTKDYQILDGQNASIGALVVPKILSFRKNETETISLINKIIDSIKAPRRNRRRGRLKDFKPKNYYDFTSVERVCPATALILCSAYHTYKMRGMRFNFYDFENWNEDVKRVFKDMGFFEFLGVDISVGDQHSADLNITTFKSGNQADAEITWTYLEYLIDGFNKIRRRHRLTEIQEKSIHRFASAIVEAVENSVRHAYNSSMPKDIIGRWWIGGVCEATKGEITLVCYDAGISIPRSLQTVDVSENMEIRNWISRVIERFIKKNSISEDLHSLDHKRLELAMKYLRSSRATPGAGKGLHHIAESIAEFPRGSVDIYSRRAYHRVATGARPTSRLLSESLPGTLIVWRLGV